MNAVMVLLFQIVNQLKLVVVRLKTLGTLCLPKSPRKCSGDSIDGLQDSS